MILIHHKPINRWIIDHNSRLCLINFSAKPNLLCVLITLKLVICPCDIPSAGSSSILAKTYPTILGASYGDFFGLDI